MKIKTYKGVDWHCIGPHRLACGDNRDILPTLPKGVVDAVVTDPPYGNKDTHEGHLSQVVLRNGEAAGQPLHFDGITEDAMSEMVKLWVQISKRWVVFTCEWKFAKRLDDDGLLIRLGIWRKPDGAPQFTGDRPGTGWEAVAICHRHGKKRWNGGGKHAFWNYPKGENKTGHPTGKPIGLFTEFVRDFTDPSEIILDPFMGSGTTGVACIRTNRRFIGIEVDPTYFQIALKRIQNEHEKDRSSFAPLLRKQPTPNLGLKPPRKKRK